MTTRIPPPIEEEPSPRATQEADSLRQGLELDSETKDHARREVLLTIVYVLAYFGVAVGGLAFISGVGILVFHHLSPAEQHWLSDQQLRDLRTIGTSGLSTAVVVEVGRRYLFRDRP